MDSSGQGPRSLTALIGDNGSGKTTLLQAIALTLSMATRRTPDMASFDWHGFLPERVPSLGPTRVELDVVFDPEEVAVTEELFEAWADSLPSERRQNMTLVPPSDHEEVNLHFEKGRVNSTQGFAAVNQFLGRFYIKKLMNSRPDLRDRFSKLGDVFWFDQHRNLGSVMPEDSSGGQANGEGWQAGVEQLREYLVGWWGHHATPGRRGKDYIEPLEILFQKVFPGTRFVGIEPKEASGAPKAGNFYFLIERGGRVYDLAEMSSGEQAVFPLIYEFVRLDIRRSIVLIDELELHLHPPEQQRVLAALPKIGSDCQFFITTHSEFLTSTIPADRIVRLEKGLRCL
jgi:energy-coupling factor transporter ATP-binding protein EcfA2